MGLGSHTEGLFSIPPNKGKLVLLQKHIDEGITNSVLYPNFSVVGISDLSNSTDYHEIGGLLRQFLSKLPEPLIPSNHTKEMMSYLSNFKS